MAETDEIIELGWKLGFSGLVFNAVSTHSFQYLHMEVLPRCQLNALSWKDAKLPKLYPNCSKLLKTIKLFQNFQIWV